MKNILSRYKIWVALVSPLLWSNISYAQTNLLVNGGFEDINTCTEYSAECGVEAWFYLKDVKAQMLANESGNSNLGNNSYGIFYNWNEYKGFTPIIGTLLPCGLQKGQQYTFKGLLSARLDRKLLFRIGVCLGERFYVIGRPFSKQLYPDSIVSLKKVKGLAFYEFEYSFTATGKEKYLTFGSFIEEDFSFQGRKKLATPQIVSLIIDNFQLVPEDDKETWCGDFEENKKIIYAYNFRHKEMDYSLYGRGELAIAFPENESNHFTRVKEIQRAPKADTLKLGDVFFDFNKAELKPAAVDMLSKYFIDNHSNNTIDSIYIEGHTDSIGSDQRNLQLSLERCESVKNWLTLNHIITTVNFSIHPFGRSRPVASNKTPAGRALNRRVEIIIFRQKEY